MEKQPDNIDIALDAREKGIVAIPCRLGTKIPASYFLDPIYQGFLKSVVVPSPDVWAALTMFGELSWGVMLALGLCTPVAALGLLFQSFNYVNMKSFVSHGAYTDKAFFAADLFCLIVNAGLVYGLDASLRHHVPASVARTLMGAPVGDDEPAPVPQVQPSPV